MKGDFTHFTHRQEKRYTRVLEQQGRVRLDADFNEWVEIVHHLERTEAVDVIGRCGVPKHGGGFEIALDGGELTISRGRIYVDGILCSNEAEDEPDPVLLDAQPDLPGYEPPLEDDGTYLVYLDVWERHITAVEDPELREVALGGPDTTTRTQTICQVKVEPLGEITTPLDALECQAFDPPDADGRLAARAELTKEPSDPCALPAKAGYRGLENRLYRVEIHDADGPTFKWSRDNGSVVLPISMIDKEQVTVETLGRDEVLTVREGDWVEILGDETELRGEPGTLAQIANGGIDRAEREITLSKDVSAHAGEGHLKLRRWDHDATGDVALQNGALPLQGDWFELEDGVEIQFDKNKTYHVGDYWVIPARTRLGKVRWPEEGSKPKKLHRLGIDHHYCTLALARREAGEWAEVSDCRPEFPPLTEAASCCTEVVYPGESIQRAIDSLPPEGGCVCLKVGEHVIDAPIFIGRDDVHLHGESPGARVVRSEGEPLVLEISGARDVVVDSVEWVGGFALLIDSELDALVRIHESTRVTLDQCRFQAKFGGKVGIDIVDGVDVSVQGCELDGVTEGILAFRGSRLVVEDCQMLALPFWGNRGIFTSCAERNRICDNRFDGFREAVLVAAPAESSLVEANHIHQMRPFGWGNEAKVYAIWVAAPGTVVRDNVIAVAEGQGGIHLTAQDTRAETNRIEITAFGDGELPIGILVEEWAHGYFRAMTNPVFNAGWMFLNLNTRFDDSLRDDVAPRPTVSPIPPTLPSLLPVAGDGVVVADNWFYGPQNGVVVEGTRGTRVQGNHLDGLSTTESVGVTLRDSVEARVTGNRIERFHGGVHLENGESNEVEGNQILGGDTGVSADGELDLRVFGNEIDGAAVGGCFCMSLRRSATFADNHLTRCGWRGPDNGVGVGIGVVTGIGEVNVRGCKVLDTGIPPDGRYRKAKQAFGLSVGPVIHLRVEGNTVGYTRLTDQNPSWEDRAIFTIGWVGARVRLPRREFMWTLAVGSALILGNELQGPGRSALVEIPRFEIPRLDTFIFSLVFDRVTFSNNHCEHLTHLKLVEKELATVRLHGGEMIVTGNHVKATQDGLVPINFSAFDFHGHPRVALTGNVSTGGYLDPFGSIPTNHQDFNIIWP